MTVHVDRDLGTHLVPDEFANLRGSDASHIMIRSVAASFTSGDLASILHDRDDELRLVTTNAFAFLLGLLADQSVRVEVAWSFPFRLQDRIGTMDPIQMSFSCVGSIRAAIERRPALHRYPGVLAQRVKDAAQRVVDSYNGDVSLIWSNASAIDVSGRLLAFNGIGPKKASLGVQMLIREWGITLQGISDVDIAIDRHVRRVLRRYWGEPKASDGWIAAQTRMLVPDLPVSFTPMAWAIGRTLCRPSKPHCGECPLVSQCQAQSSFH